MEHIWQLLLKSLAGGVLDWAAYNRCLACIRQVHQTDCIAFVVGERPSKVADNAGHPS